MNKIITIVILAAAAAIPTAGQAAVNLGDNVSCAVTGGGTFSCNAPMNTIQAGTEFNIGNGPDFYLGVDFAPGLLTINALQDSNLGSTILNFQDLTSEITSFLLLGSSGFDGFDQSDLSLTGGMLSIDLRNTSNSSGGSIQLALGSTVGAVPEPATWAMFLIGFGAIGCSMRRRRSQAAVRAVSVR